MKHLFLITAVLLTSCGDGGKGTAEQAADTTVTTRATYVVDLSEHDVPLKLDLGDRNTLGTDTVVVTWNEDFGRLEVRAGEHFGLNITEEPADLTRWKADLDRDMLQKHTILEEGPDRLVYRSEFPDEAGVFIHFYRFITTAGRTFVITDTDEGRFNETDVQRMLKALVNDKAA